MQGITNLVVGKAQDAGILVLMDRISALLLVTHEGGTADLYLQNVPFEMEIMAKRDFAKGEAVYQSGIADVRRLRMSWLKLQPKDGMLCCFKVGWKFALFFDLDRRCPSGRTYRRTGQGSVSQEAARLRRK